MPSGFQVRKSRGARRAPRIISLLPGLAAIGGYGTIQSLLTTCRLHDVNPHAGLVDVLHGIDQHPAGRTEELTPRVWKDKFSVDPPLSDPDRVRQERPGLNAYDETARPELLAQRLATLAARFVRCRRYRRRHPSPASTDHRSRPRRQPGPRRQHHRDRAYPRHPGTADAQRRGLRAVRRPDQDRGDRYIGVCGDKRLTGELAPPQPG